MMSEDEKRLREAEQVPSDVTGVAYNPDGKGIELGGHAAITTPNDERSQEQGKGEIGE